MGIPIGGNLIPDNDVVILHDSLFQKITEGILKKENLSVKKVWTPRVHDALEYVTAMNQRPKVVILHSATNDLSESDDDVIIDDILKLHEILETRDIKMIYSYIWPRNDERDLNAKAQVINAIIDRKLSGKSNVTIARNDNFYKRGSINGDLFTEDGIHLNDEGSRNLANNTKDAVSRSLEIDIVQPKRRNVRQNDNNRNSGRNYMFNMRNGYH